MHRITTFTAIAIQMTPMFCRSHPADRRDGAQLVNRQVKTNLTDEPKPPDGNASSPSAWSLPPDNVSNGTITNITTSDFQAVSADILEQLGRFAQFAAASYCTQNVNVPAGNKPILCTPEAGTMTATSGKRDNLFEQTNVCPLVEKLNTKIVAEFLNAGSISETTGYIALDHTNKNIVLSYRGTHELRQWIVNFGAVPRLVTELCSTCVVHYGFWAAFQKTQELIVDTIKAQVTAYSTYRVIVVGHSLGGALANLATVILRNEKLFPVDMYSYGAPRVGFFSFARYAREKPGWGFNYRVSHKHDPVPGLPPRTGPIGFWHVWPQYYVKSGNGEEVTTNDVKKKGFWSAKYTFTDADEANSLNVPPEDAMDVYAPVDYDGTLNGHIGNENLSIPSIDAHLWYFGPMSGCDPDNNHFSGTVGDVGQAGNGVLVKPGEGPPPRVETVRLF